MYYNGNPNRMRAFFKCTESDKYSYTYTLKWKEIPRVVSLNNATLEKLQTGDSITMYLVIVTISSTGLLINIIYLKRKEFLRKKLKNSYN